MTLKWTKTCFSTVRKLCQRHKHKCFAVQIFICIVVYVENCVREKHKCFAVQTFICIVVCVDIHPSCWKSAWIDFWNSFKMRFSLLQVSLLSWGGGLKKRSSKPAAAPPQGLLLETVMHKACLQCCFVLHLSSLKMWLYSYYFIQNTSFKSYLAPFIGKYSACLACSPSHALLNAIQTYMFL